MSIMYAQMGLSLVNSIGQFANAGIEADLQESIQAYQNTMANLSAARSKNAVTLNEVRTRDQSTRANELIQKTALSDQARAKVAAASAGVSGNSIDLAVADLKASAGRAGYAQKRNTQQALQELGNQRKSISINTLLGKNTDIIPRPNVGSLLLGAGTQLLNIYDNDQPSGSKLLE